MQFLNKKLISILVVACLFFGISNFCYADNVMQRKRVEQKRVALKEKIKSLSILERQETNKLSRNQQKLEINKRALRNSKAQYAAKQENIIALQKDLNSYIMQYNQRQNLSAQRIRCIYKTKHTLILDLLLSTDSVSQFLDRIYYQNLIIESDKRKNVNYQK